MANIYVASSWRNWRQPEVVRQLREAGHEVYDFRNPPHGRGGFAWSEISPSWQQWTAAEYRAALDTVIAKAGFQSDLGGMESADVCLLLLPCGRSAHIEAGWMAGVGAFTIVLTQDGEEPELMAKLLDYVCIDMAEVLERLAFIDGQIAASRAIPAEVAANG